MAQESRRSHVINSLRTENQTLECLGFGLDIGKEFIRCVRRELEGGMIDSGDVKISSSSTSEKWTNDPFLEALSLHLPAFQLI